MNKSKVAGVNLKNPAVKEQIYERYLQAYKKGVFNYIKEDPSPDGQLMPKKYFSGGVLAMPRDRDIQRVHGFVNIPPPSGAMIAVLVVIGVGVLVTAGIRRFLESKRQDMISDSLRSSSVTNRVYAIYNDYAAKRLHLRDYFKKINSTSPHFERKAAIVLALLVLRSVLKPGTSIPQEYFEYFIRMAKDNDPEIALIAKEALAAAIISNPTQIEEIPAPLQAEVIGMTKLKGVDFKEGLRGYGIDERHHFTAVTSSQKIKNAGRSNEFLPKSVDWLLPEIDKYTRDPFILEYLLETAGEIRGVGSDLIAKRVLELIPELQKEPLRKEEQLRGAVARALSYKNEPGVAEALIEMLNTTLSEIDRNNLGWKSETINECVNSLETNDHPEFKQAWAIVSARTAVPTLEEFRKALSEIMRGSRVRETVRSAAMHIQDIESPGGIDLNQINLTIQAKKSMSNSMRPSSMNWNRVDLMVLLLRLLA